MDQQPDIKHCPLCNNDLPVGDFGMCRARRDGRNLYCKACIREKVATARRNLKEYKAARKRYQSQLLEIVEWTSNEVPSYQSKQGKKLSPVERVREAIRKGCRTQHEIGMETKLGKDEIGDALTKLLLWQHEIRTQIVGETRYYFFVEQLEPLLIPDRKPVVLAPFHELQAFMPGRKRAVG